MERLRNKETALIKWKNACDPQEAPKSNEELENHSVLKWTIHSEPFMDRGSGRQEKAWVPPRHTEGEELHPELSQNSCPPPPIHTSLHL